MSLPMDSVAVRFISVKFSTAKAFRAMSERAAIKNFILTPL
jgi:hypothetical protein